MKDWFRIQLTDEQREQQMRRLMFVETNIMLPIKVVAIFVASYIFAANYHFLLTLGWGTSMPEIVQRRSLYYTLTMYYTLLKVCTVGNLFFWGLLLLARFGRFWPGLLWSSAWFLRCWTACFSAVWCILRGGCRVFSIGCT